MHAPLIRDAVEADFEALLRLNRESEHFLSPMDGARLRHLYAQAAYCRVACIEAEVAAFLLAFGEGADYDSPNYRWFGKHHAGFLYIDRIVVEQRRQGQKLGSLLYRDLFAFARERGVASVTCEFDVIPPNQASRLFHARFGFREVGTQWVAGGTKQVSLQLASSAAILSHSIQRGA